MKAVRVHQSGGAESFVYEEAPAAIAHNPRDEAEWAEYFAYLRDFPGHSTESWRTWKENR